MKSLNGQLPRYGPVIYPSAEQSLANTEVRCPVDNAIFCLSQAKAKSRGTNRAAATDTEDRCWRMRKNDVWHFVHHRIGATRGHVERIVDDDLTRSGAPARCCTNSFPCHVLDDVKPLAGPGDAQARCGCRASKSSIY